MGSEYRMPLLFNRKGTKKTGVGIVPHQLFNIIFVKNSFSRVLVGFPFSSFRGIRTRRRGVHEPLVSKLVNFGDESVKEVAVVAHEDECAVVILQGLLEYILCL